MSSWFPIFMSQGLHLVFFLVKSDLGVMRHVCIAHSDQYVGSGRACLADTGSEAELLKRHIIHQYLCSHPLLLLLRS
jgi:hypothetical protein